MEFRTVARRFNERHILPIAAAIDQGEEQLPEDLLAEMAKMGYFGIHLPEEWGGAGLDMRTVVIITEELCRGLLSAGSVLGRNLLMGEMLLRHGTEDQKHRFLEGVASGLLQTASAGTEPDAGSDAANISTRAVRDGDDYILTGTKMWCTFADRADLLFVQARTSDSAEKKHQGISCFIVEKPAGPDFSAPTLTGTPIPTVGYHGMRSFMLYFDKHRVPANNLLGEIEGKGFLSVNGRVRNGSYCVRCPVCRRRPSCPRCSTRLYPGAGPIWKAPQRFPGHQGEGRADGN